MNNYPPGVTGNEPQIAGYSEHQIDFECDNDEVLRVEDGEEIFCSFDGKADAELTYSSRTEVVWWVTCPVCGYEREVVWEDD